MVRWPHTSDVNPSRIRRAHGPRRKRKGKRRIRQHFTTFLLSLRPPRCQSLSSLRNNGFRLRSQRRYVSFFPAPEGVWLVRGDLARPITSCADCPLPHWQSWLTDCDSVRSLPLLPLLARGSWMLCGELGRGRGRQEEVHPSSG